MSGRLRWKSLIGGILVPLVVPVLLMASAADPQPQQPTWTDRILNSLTEIESGLTVGLNPKVTSEISRQQARLVMEQIKRQGGTATRETVRGMGRLADGARALGKAVKVVDAVVDAGEVFGAGMKGGPEAAAIKAADVGLNEGAAYAGAVAGAKFGAFVGSFFGPGPGSLVGGIIGGAGGAFAATLGYEWLIRPHFNEEIQRIVDEKNPNKRGFVPPTTGKPRPPGFTTPRDPSRPPTEQKDTVLRCTRLIVVPAGDVEAGDTAQFTALADLSVDTTDPIPATERKDVVVTGEAAWTFSGGRKTAQGQAATDCGLAGQSITATATFLDRTAVATARVKPLPLVSLTVLASPSAAPPGGAVTLTARAVYKNANCEETKTNPPGVEFSCDRGASVSGSALKIDLDKEDGAVVAYASLPQEQRTSGGVSISVIPPVLERISLSAPASVDVCQPVTFKLFGYYSHKPEESRLLAPEMANWTFSGRCAPLGTDTVRAMWPGETIRAEATTPEGRGAEAVVTVNPLPESSPWFPIEDVSSFSVIRVGDTMKNVALEFACQGSRHVPRPSTAVEWSSDAPEILSCAPDGTCQGLEPGTATLTVTYAGRVITSRPVTVTEDTEATDEGFTADEEVSGDQLEAAAAEPPKTGEPAESAPPDQKDSQAFKTGEKIGRLLAGALGQALERKLNKDKEAPPGGTPPGGGPGSAPQGTKPQGASNDPFVGNWRLTLFRITGHSAGPDQSDIDEANAMAASMSATLSIRGSEGAYSVSGLPLRVTRITASGQTITIEGRDPTGKDDEVMRLTLKGNTLAGTYKVTMAPDYFGRREWQTADIAFARQ